MLYLSQSCVMLYEQFGKATDIDMPTKYNQLMIGAVCIPMYGNVYMTWMLNACQ